MNSLNVRSCHPSVKYDRRIQILVEKSVLVRDFQKVQDIHDHLQMGKEKNLRHIPREIFFARLDACPQTRLGFA